MKMKNIFLTGGSSYLGKNFIKKNKNSQIFALKHNKEIGDDKNLNIINDNSSFNELFKYHNIDTVIHFASNYSYKNTDKTRKLNYRLEERLIEASQKSDVNRFIFAGSYFQDIFFGESIPYVVYKNNIEKKMMKSSKSSNVYFASLHLGDVFGQNDFRNKLIPYLLKSENQSKLKIESDGNGPFSPIHIDDVLSYIFNLELKKDIYFEIHNLYGKVTSVKEFIDFYKKVRDKKFECDFNLSNKSKNYKLKNVNEKFLDNNLEIQLLNL